MTLSTDIRVIGATLYFLPVQTRVPYKFGAVTMSQVTCARVCLCVRDRDGREAQGWGETPLSVGWAWPSPLPYETRHEAMKGFCISLAKAWAGFEAWGHPLEVGHDFLEHVLPGLGSSLPPLAALVCASAFDVALHDAFGVLHGVPVYETYGAGWLSRDLSHFLDGDQFKGRYPRDFLLPQRQAKVWAWHSVGLADAVDTSQLSGDEPQDGYPVTLDGWIERDGLKCLKVKTRGDDPDWDFEHLKRVGQVALPLGVEALCADFNCTAHDVEGVVHTLKRLQREAPQTFEALLYVEQPFGYDLEAGPRDVRAISDLKPLFIDESAHDWRAVRRGRELGYTGVALKTCKTQTGALLSACWARAHGLPLMVQDLTNPMLALIPHALLAAHLGTLRGAEANAMQFYPDASLPEMRAHPDLYRRVGGQLDLSSVRGPGFGYRLDEIERDLPAPVVEQ